MALARYEGTVVDTAGNVVPLATIEVRRDQAGRPIVPLFSDRAGMVPIGNPIQADAQGAFAFHAPGGAYRVRAYTGASQSPTFEVIKRYVGIGTAAERDVDELASMLNAGLGIFSTVENLELFTPEADNVGARVLNDPDPALNGDYIYITDEWVKQRGLPDTLGRMTAIGGDENDIEAEVAAGVDPGNVVMLFIEPDETNTGAVTINDLPVLSLSGDDLLAGQFIAGRSYLMTLEGDHYRLRQESDLDGLSASIESTAAAGLTAINTAKNTALSEIDAEVTTATTQAGIATTKAGEAAASALSVLGVSSAAFNSRTSYSTWTALAAVTGAAGDAAEVMPSDTGTHTGYKYGDDVSTAGLVNPGVYIWSASLSAWRRVFDSTIITFDDFVSRIAGTSAQSPLNAAGQVHYWAASSIAEVNSGRVSTLQAFNEGSVLLATQASRPVHKGRTISFDGVAHFLELPASRNPKLVATTMLPDAALSPASGGFTVTGMANKLGDIRILAQFGKKADADPTYAPSLVYLTPDFRRIMSEVQLAPLFSGIGGIQGIAYDPTDGSVWVADVANKAIQHVSAAGTVAAGSITGLAYEPNGLAYVPEDDALWAMSAAGTFYKYSCAGGTLLTSFTTDLLVPDQLAYHAPSKHLLVSAGGNGVDGTVYVLDTMSQLVSWRVPALTMSQSPEGMILDGRRLFEGNDGGLHTEANPPLNIVNEYDLGFDLPVAAADDKLVVALAFMRTSLNTGGLAGYVIAQGIPTDNQPGWGLLLTAGADTIQFQGRDKNASANYVRTWPITSLNVMTNLVLVIEPGVSATLYQHGEVVTPSATTGSLSSFALPANVAQISIGAGNRFGVAGNRPAGFELVGAGVFNADEDREQIEVWQADEAGTWSLLTDDNPFKAPELVVNGDFPTDVAGWLTPFGVVVTWDASGKASVTTNSTTVGQRMSQIIGLVPGKTYRFQATANVASSFRIASSSNFIDGIQVSGTGTSIDATFVATAATAYVGMRPSATSATGIYDSVSVKRVG